MNYFQLCGSFSLRSTETIQVDYFYLNITNPRIEEDDRKNLTQLFACVRAEKLQVRVTSEAHLELLLWAFNHSLVHYPRKLALKLDFSLEAKDVSLLWLENTLFSMVETLSPALHSFQVLSL